MYVFTLNFRFFFIVFIVFTIQNAQSEDLNKTKSLLQIDLFLGNYGEWFESISWPGTTTLT